MDGAKAFFNKVAGLGGAQSQGVGGNGKEGKSRFGNGIGNTMLGGSSVEVGGASGYLGTWGEDRVTNIAIALRIFQMICVFSMLIVVIVLATFQTKWIGKLSGLTVLLLIVTLCTILLVGFLCFLSFFPDSWHVSQDKIIRVLEQPRLGLAMNGTGVAVWLIIAMAQTISAYTMPGCKDPATDPHANDPKGRKDDFIDALPGFCTSKRAGAAFAWFIFATCVGTTLLFLRTWKLSRKNGPRIPPFVNPGEDGAFEPLGEDMGHDDDDNVYARDHAGGASSNRYGDGGDGRYGYGEGYDDPRAQAMYGGPYDPDGLRYDTRRSDPFADHQQAPPRQSYDYGAYAASSTNVQDPYAAIQQQLRSERPPQLPPLYRAG